MIRKETIDKIFEIAAIEEVVGDFVNLKKRGANLLGNCPFHNEKTPSFTVSPTKGIYKCFGCGKAGNSVNFIMEHEKLTYPDALRQLAKKYNIAIEEDGADVLRLYVMNSGLTYGEPLKFKHSEVLELKQKFIQLINSVKFYVEHTVNMEKKVNLIPNIDIINQKEKLEENVLDAWIWHCAPTWKLDLV
jgi:DNA primase